MSSRQILARMARRDMQDARKANRAMAKAALKSAPRGGIEWMWMQSTNNKERWSATHIPDGDIHAPYIKRMSKESDGTWTFYVFRNNKCIGVTKDKSTDKGLEAAKAWAKAGKVNQAAIEDNKQMLEYVDGKTRDPKLFAKLSKISQVTIANAYTWAMPSDRALDVAKVAKPKTTRTDLMGKHEKQAVRAGKHDLDAVIKRVKKEPNPKKAGSIQWQRWEIVFAMVGKTVREFFAQGGDKYGLEGALEMGWIKLEGK